MTFDPPDDANPDGRGDRFVIMLGSNIDPERCLLKAVQELHSLGRLLAVSSVWQTAAVGDTQQADFCNAAVLIETSLDASELLIRLSDIEARLGRVRDPQNKNAARTIDLDLAVLPGPARMAAGKRYPDPDIAERVFLAVPLQEIWPEFQFADGRRIAEVADQLRRRDGERLRLARRSDIELNEPGRT